MLGECVVKIKDITEGLYDFVDKLGKQSKQASWSAGKGDKEEYLKNYRDKLRNIEIDKIKKIHQRDNELNVDDPTTTAQPQISNPQEGSVLLVKAANGEYYFKSYNGTWHLKGKAPDDFSVGGTKIANPADVTALDALLPKAQLVGVKPVPNEPPTAWVYDQRKTALLNKRRGVK